MSSKQGVFIVWKEYQRRVEVLAPFFDLEVRYFYCSWEAKSKILKVASYLLKSVHTLIYLFKNKPPLVFIQFPPPPALYCVALYAWLSGVDYIADCHIGLTNANWLNWLYVKKLLARGRMIVHNERLVMQVVESMNLKPVVIRDGIVNNSSIPIRDDALLDVLGLATKSYVIIPCSFSPDEPLQEIIEAARLLPEIKFVMTWYSEKLSKGLRNNLPANVLLTGYLPVKDYNRLFTDSGVALVLTEHENVQLSGMQEAMAFGIPAVVTDLVTTRCLYKNYPVYVRNNRESISHGVLCAFRDRLALERNMKILRDESEREFLDQIAKLKLLLNP